MLIVARVQMLRHSFEHLCFFDQLLPERAMEHHCLI
jgi:hypothetical protein